MTTPQTAGAVRRSRSGKALMPGAQPAVPDNAAAALPAGFLPAVQQLLKAELQPRQQQVTQLQADIAMLEANANARVRNRFAHVSGTIVPLQVRNPNGGAALVPPDVPSDRFRLLNTSNTSLARLQRLCTAHGLATEGHKSALAGRIRLHLGMS